MTQRALPIIKEPLEELYQAIGAPQKKKSTSESTGQSTDIQPFDHPSPFLFFPFPRTFHSFSLPFSFFFSD
jgi:hypothetical protein